MELLALPQRAPRSVRLLALAAVVTTVLAAGCADDDDTIIDYWPAEPRPGELDAHVEGRIEVSNDGETSQPGPVLLFELHDDGSVFSTSDDSSNPFGLVRYKLTHAGTERARELLAGIDLDDDAYGEPTITDMPSTSVAVNLDGTPDDLSVYALADLDDMGDLGLGAGQRHLREALQTTLDQLTALADDAGLVAEPPTTYTPDRIDVAFVPWYFDTSEGSAAPEPLDWPLATPLTDLQLGRDRAARLCVTVDGDDAATLTSAMGITSPGAQERPWSTGATAAAAQPTEVAVQVHGLRPHEAACADQTDPPTGGAPPRVAAGPLYTVELSDPAAWDGGFPADDLRQAEPLEVDAVVPAVAAAAAGDADLQLTTSDLSWYDYRAVVAVADGTSYVDIVAQPTAGATPDPGEPTTWRIRTDLTTKQVTAVETG